tara:strand:+ start:214385 stop:214723 length:339 start_codon:yes stop_codon:yes gene_type:complete
MDLSRKKLIKMCEEKLIKMKHQYDATLSSKSLLSEEKTEAVDMATRELQFQDSSFFRLRIKSLLPEINMALRKIANGTYGICEETGMEIEQKRLLAMPWARVSMKAFRQQAS